jgi:hypothetical protein
MPGADDIGIENVSQGICGFTSTLYAVYLTRPQLQRQLERAMDASMRSFRLMAEIKTFLQMMKADGKNEILEGITELTKSFPGYGGWTVKTYIEDINKLQAKTKYSIAMPPEAVLEYMSTCWDMRPVVTDQVLPGDCILGLTRTGGPQNRWKNLAHYVFQSAGGRIYSWGEQFSNLSEVNTAKKKDYSVVYRIMLHG